VDSKERRTSTHPAEKGKDQETVLIMNRFPESTDSIMLRSQLERKTVSRGEDKIGSFPVPY